MSSFSIDWLLGLTPILLILLLMIVLHWSVSRSGAFGWIAAAVIAVWRFGAGMDLLSIAQVKALLLTLDVLLVIWAAFLFYRVTEEAGTTKLIGELLPKLTSDRGFQILLIGFVFASFMQGIAGFGVPLAIVAPILVWLGYSPVLAVAMASIGCTWAVTFGTLAVAYQTLLSTTGLPSQVLAAPTALFLGLVAIMCGLMVVQMGEGWSGLRHSFWSALWLGITMGGTQYLLAVFGFWNIAAFGAGIAGIVMGVLIARFHPRETTLQSTPDSKRHSLLIPFVGYIVLLLLTLSIQLVPAFGHLIDIAVIKVHFNETRTALGYLTPAGDGRVIHIFTHAGMIIAYASLISYLIYARLKLVPRDTYARILKDTLKNVIPSSLGVATMVSMAVIMLTSGMTETIARGLAIAMGNSFGFVSPWIGALGAFITGSNTNSNLLFDMLQKRTVELLGFSVAIILATQTTGASIGCAFAPTRIIMGTITAGNPGEEGLVLRKVLPYAVGLIVLVGILALLLL